MGTTGGGVLEWWGGAVDAGGGGPLGEDDGVVAEFIADGGVEDGDEIAGLADLGAGAGGLADVAGAVIGLLGALPNSFI